MATVLGYLRPYRRWNGMPGLTLAGQRALVSQVVGDLEFGRGRRVYLSEAADGEARGWPVLKEVISRAKDDAGLGFLVVIPTLDGVQFNLSFLGLLADPECNGVPICVYSGWRRVGRLALGTNYERRAEHNFWHLAHGDQWSAFKGTVERIRQRNGGLPKSIRAGLQNLVACGIQLGARRHGAHRFTAAEQSKGGRLTARKRRLAANGPYLKWIPDICRWRAKGMSLGEVAMRLADRGIRTPNGRKINPMLVWRILKRELAKMGRRTAQTG